MAVLFENGFEEGDFSAWTGTTTGGGAVMEVVSNVKYEGTYSGHFSVPSGSWATIYKQLPSSYSEIYTREYVYLNSTPVSGDAITMMGVFSGTPSDANTISVAGLHNSGGTPYWDIKWRDGASLTKTISTEEATTGSWHCIETKTKIHGTEGEIKMWVDGVNIISLTGKDTDANGNASYVSAECGTWGEGSAGEDWVDDYIVSETYIGPDPTSIAVADTGSGADVLSVLSKVGLAETGSGADNAGLKASTLLQDTGNSSELLNILSKVLVVDSKYGKALNLDGNNDYIDFGSDTSLNLTTALSFGLWVKPHSSQEICYTAETGGNAGLAAKVEGAENSSTWSWQLRYGSADACRLGFQAHDTVGSTKWVTVGQDLTNDQWYHLVVTFDGSNLRMYLDGNLVDTTAMEGNITSYLNKLIIGAEGWGEITDYFDGDVDDIRLYNRALSNSENEKLSKGREISSTGLVSYWTLNEGEGSTINDSVGSNTGTPYGATWIDSTVPITSVASEALEILIKMGLVDTGSGADALSANAQVSLADKNLPSKSYF